MDKLLQHVVWEEHSMDAELTLADEVQGILGQRGITLPVVLEEHGLLIQILNIIFLNDVLLKLDRIQLVSPLCLAEGFRDK